MSCWIYADGVDAIGTASWVGDLIAEQFRPPAIDEALYDRTFAPQVAGMGVIHLHDLSAEDASVIGGRLTSYADELNKSPEGSSERFVATEVTRVIKLLEESRAAKPLEPQRSI